MIKVVCPSSRLELSNILSAAFERSCGLGSVQNLSYSDLIKSGLLRSEESTSKYGAIVFVSPPEEYSAQLISILKTLTVKVIIFGILPTSLAQFLNMRVESISDKVIKASACPPASVYGFSESAGFIKYIKGLRGCSDILPLRALRRYDYSDEWNNLGFGAITSDGTMWSISACADIEPKNVIAYLMAHEEPLSAYCGLWDYSKASLFWFNREVGPIDSYEWRLIEIYISQYRFRDLPAWPVISEIPDGYEGAVTMRLDCDEDIESARSLYKAYKKWNIPFSLALHAAVLASPEHHHLPIEVAAEGGAILSHTLTHAPNWGGSKEDALREGLDSAAIIHQAIEIIPKYAVSPFHQTPLYARLGLAQAGYAGCIGGIISNDPDYVMARGGRPPYSKPNFIGHTQQCMLHGDCLLRTGDPLAIYKQAFEQAFLSKTFFGYLDHPFSERYHYGWNNEEERINAHGQLIDYIRNRFNKVLFLNENDALDFIYFKSNIYIEQIDEALKISPPTFQNETALNVLIEYGSKFYSVNSKAIVI